MSFFKSSLEKQLERDYAQVYGQETAVVLMAMAKKVVSRWEREGPTKQERARAIADGATDSDIHWWWETHPPLQKAAIQADDEGTRLNALMSLKEEGLSMPQAAERVKHGFPFFGSTDSEFPALTGEERALPFELKNRVLGGVEKGTLMAARQDASNENLSMNALIRKLMREGRL